MGVFEVEAGGKTFEIEAPSQDAALSALQQYASKGNVSVKSNAPSLADQALDFAQSTGTGLAKGAIAVAGLPGDAARLVDAGVAYAGDKLGIQPGPAQEPTLLPSSRDIQGTVESQTGEFYKPRYTLGKFGHTAAEFVPGALLGPGGALRNMIAFGIAPGVASEAAGQFTEGTPVEPYARAGAALAAGGLAGVVSAPSNVANTVSRSAQGATRQQLEAAEQLFQEAHAAGMPLTRAEALQHVTGGATNFGNLQRVVEGQGGMRDFFSQRAAQTDAAAGGVFDQVTPAAPNPSSIGPAVGRAAEGTVNDVRGAINAASDPFYRGAEAIRLAPYEMSQVRAIPGYQEARDAVRNNPQLNRYVQHLPDDSVGFLNEVKKQLDAAAEGARSPLSTNPNMQIPAGYSRDAEAARGIAVNASRRTPGNPYETALGIQEQARERFLQPLLDGPLGKLAKSDITTQRAINALFPQNPLPNSADEIATAVGALAHRNQYAARNLVRAHLEMTFNEATQNLVSGANSYGGAKFAAVLRGNPQQAANLEAAIRALPGGDQIYPGVDRFLTILEAQGQRQAVGSTTAFNQEVLQDLRQGKLVSEAGSAVLSAGVKLPGTIKQRIERWRMGSNVDELARLFTDPAAGREFMRLASARTEGQLNAAIIRLANLGRIGAGQGSAKPSEQSAKR